MRSSRELVRHVARSISVLLFVGLAQGYSFFQPSPEQSRQWVKVEGRMSEDGFMVADKVEAVPDDSLEIEGMIQSVDQAERSFSVFGFRIQLGPDGRVEDSERGERSFEDLRIGTRVKVKFDKKVGKTIRARLVRIYADSSDRDLELQGPLTRAESGPSLLSVPVRLTEKTRYINFDDSSFDTLNAPSSVGRFRDDDEPDLPPGEWAGFYFVGKLGLTFEHRSNPDLTDLIGDDSTFLRPQAQLEVVRPLSERAEFFAKFNLNREASLSDKLTSRSSDVFEFREGYFYLRRIGHHDLSLQIGRQRFRDRREWWYDDRLDAVRLHFRKRLFKLEFSAARRVFGERLSRSDQLYVIGNAQFDLPGKRYLSGYWLKRNDTTNRDEDPVWFGISSRGRITRRSRYWVEFARMMGRRGGRRLRGFGFDLGGAYRLDGSWNPTISGGYAFGSGDDDFSDGVDGNFRQTRLNDNSHRIGSLRRYRYYGIVLEPELSNLKVATIDFGIRPSPDWSLNLAYHRYRQVRPSRRIGDSELSIRPRGRDPRLGQELDVVWSMRKLGHLDLNLFFGVFFPGAAFREGSSPTTLFRQEIRYFF